jgi:hypothetical protein
MDAAVNADKIPCSQCIIFQKLKGELTFNFQITTTFAGGKEFAL